MGGFEFTVLQRNLKEWNKGQGTFVCEPKGKQQKKVRQLQCQKQWIDYIPYYLSGWLHAHFFPTNFLEIAGYFPCSYFPQSIRPSQRNNKSKNFELRFDESTTFSWTSFTLPTFLQAQSRWEIYETGRANLTQHLQRLTANILVCNVTMSGDLGWLT